MKVGNREQGIERLGSAGLLACEKCEKVGQQGGNWMFLPKKLTKKIAFFSTSCLLSGYW
jgi:hypothetical protein